MNIRQAEVEQDDFEVTRSQHAESGGAGGGTGRFDVLAFEGGAQQTSDGRIVVDDKHSFGLGLWGRRHVVARLQVVARVFNEITKGGELRDQFVRERRPRCRYGMASGRD